MAFGGIQAPNALGAGRPRVVSQRPQRITVGRPPRTGTRQGRSTAQRSGAPSAQAPLQTGPPPPSGGAGEPSPFSASYQANIAALEHQYQATLARNLATEQRDVGIEHYNVGQLNLAEPRNIQATRNRANTEGLTESGILGQRTGLVQQKATFARAQQANRLQEQRDVLAGQNRAAFENLQVGRAAADAERAEREAEARTLREEPQAALPPAAPGGPPRVIAQTPQRRTVTPRRAAANRAARRR
jgi:hypothetical protein